MATKKKGGWGGISKNPKKKKKEVEIQGYFYEQLSD